MKVSNNIYCQLRQRECGHPISSRQRDHFYAHYLPSLIREMDFSKQLVKISASPSFRKVQILGKLAVITNEKDEIILFNLENLKYMFLSSTFRQHQSTNTIFKVVFPYLICCGYLRPPNTSSLCRDFTQLENLYVWDVVKGTLLGFLKTPSTCRDSLYPKIMNNRLLTITENGVIQRRALYDFTTIIDEVKIDSFSVPRVARTFFSYPYFIIISHDVVTIHNVQDNTLKRVELQRSNGPIEITSMCVDKQKLICGIIQKEGFHPGIYVIDLEEGNVIEEYFLDLSNEERELMELEIPPEERYLQKIYWEAEKKITHIVTDSEWIYVSLLKGYIIAINLHEKKQLKLSSDVDDIYYLKIKGNLLIGKGKTMMKFYDLSERKNDFGLPATNPLIKTLEVDDGPFAKFQMKQDVLTIVSWKLIQQFDLCAQPKEKPRIESLEVGNFGELDLNEIVLDS